MKLRWRICAVAIAVVFVAVDNLVPRLDWAYINLNGWLMYGILLIPWTALLLAPGLLFGRHSRWFYTPLVFALTAIETVTMFVRWQFHGQLNGVWVNILAGATSQEIGNFCETYLRWTALPVTIAVVLFAALAVLTVSQLKELKPSRRRVGFGFLCLGAFLLLTPFCKDPLGTLESRSSVFFLTDAVRNWGRYERLKHMATAPLFPEELRRDERVDGSLFGVFVVGESATRNRWHCYGYSRPTTPCVEALGSEAILFKDVRTAAIHTVRALPLMLTTATVEKEDDLRFSFPQALARLGYETTLFANQERIGKFCGSEPFVFAGCGKMLFLPETAVGYTAYDDALLPYLYREMKDASHMRPHVSILHLAGSHAPSVDHYPPDFNPFKARPVQHSRDRDDVALMSDHYDNSIAFTDKVLGDVVSALKRRGGPAWMVYIPDHGESPSEKSWRMVTSRDVWEIPMVIWLSPEYSRRFPETVEWLRRQAREPQRSDHFLELFLRIAGVQVRDHRCAGQWCPRMDNGEQRWTVNNSHP